MGIKIKTSDNFDIGIIPIEIFSQSMFSYDLVDALLFIQRVNAQSMVLLDNSIEVAFKAVLERIHRVLVSLL